MDGFLFENVEEEIHMIPKGWPYINFFWADKVIPDLPLSS